MFREGEGEGCGLCLHAVNKHLHPNVSGGNLIDASIMCRDGKCDEYQTKATTSADWGHGSVGADSLQQTCPLSGLI